VSLASREELSIEDLADFETHDSAGNYPATTLDAWSPARTPSGKPIRRHLQSPTINQIFALVAAGEIVHLATSPVFLGYPGMVYVSVTDMPPMQAALIWLTDEETSAIRAFADAARETMSERAGYRRAGT
jgi:hypothetical protein